MLSQRARRWEQLTGGSLRHKPWIARALEALRSLLLWRMSKVFFGVKTSQWTIRRRAALLCSGKEVNCTYSIHQHTRSLRFLLAGTLSTRSSCSRRSRVVCVSKVNAFFLWSGQGDYEVWWVLGWQTTDRAVGNRMLCKIFKRQLSWCHRSRSWWKSRGQTTSSFEDRGIRAEIQTVQRDLRAHREVCHTAKHTFWIIKKYEKKNPKV